VNVSVSFEAASAYFGANTNRFTSAEQLELYGLFKQVTDGDAPAATEGSWSLDPRRRATNEAWKSRRGMSTEAAAEAYVEVIEKKCPLWRSGKSDEASSYAEEGEKSGWAVGSLPVDVIGTDDRDESQIGRLCLAVAEGENEHVTSFIESEPGMVVMQDKDGMTCLHWACDRGNEELVALLLAKKSDPNIQDHCGNTPLHIAAMAGQKHVLRLLLDANADVSISNKDGESAACVIKSEFPKFFI
jgi:acyl-CoA-binding protein